MTLKNEKVVVVGLGYVGLPLAIALSRTFEVVGLDTDPVRIQELRANHDRTSEVSEEALAQSNMHATTLASDCGDASYYIITVPTPVDSANRPDLKMVLSASRSIAPLLNPALSPIVIYESTVYPGVTEDICGPLLEEHSGLSRGKGFFLGYSPERINPGDREHTIDRIVKVVSGENPEITEKVAALYGAVTEAGVYRAASIRVAEAAKVIENAQRDINIAFMNEITQIFHKLGISAADVLDAARTKWNFLNFRPGLVGGHCIGVDPYYLSHCAQSLGHLPRVILAGRSINDSMGSWMADEIHTRLGAGQKSLLILGVTFKEDVPDVRNTRVADLISRLRWLGHTVCAHDPLADAEVAKEEVGIEICTELPEQRYDAVIAAVPHRAYRDMPQDQVEGLLLDKGLIADPTGMWIKRSHAAPIQYWSF
ncbi:MAG TPA: nucleotide sugar dehydrogenase [Allosphingosinicella sp.]|jgi:UDP-N-acetyl-D-galactosamine dehydrogenase